MWKPLTILILFILPVNHYSTEIELLKTVIQDQYLIVDAKPLDLILRDAEAGSYIDFIKVYHNFDLTPELLDEIMTNANVQKPKNWKDEELPNQFIWQRGTPIKVKDALKKLNPQSAQEKDRMKKLFKTFNSNTRRQPLFVMRVSRPAYSNDGTFAIVGTSVSNGGNISLFHLEDNIWVWKGMLKKWEY